MPNNVKKNPPECYEWNSPWIWKLIIRVVFCHSHEWTMKSFAHVGAGENSMEWRWEGKCDLFILEWYSLILCKTQYKSTFHRIDHAINWFRLIELSRIFIVFPFLFLLFRQIGTILYYPLLFVEFRIHRGYLFVFCDSMETRSVCATDCYFSISLYRFRSFITALR